MRYTSDNLHLNLQWHFCSIVMFNPGYISDYNSNYDVKLKVLILKTKTMLLSFLFLWIWLCLGRNLSLIKNVWVVVLFYDGESLSWSMVITSDNHGKNGKLSFPGVLFWVHHPWILSLDINHILVHWHPHLESSGKEQKEAELRWFA